MNRFLSVILFSALLCSLPFSAGLWLWNQLTITSWEEEREAGRERLSQIVSHFARLSDPESFFQETAARVQRALIWEADPRPFLSRFQPGIARFHLFGSNRRHQSLPGFSEEFVSASEICLDLILRESLKIRKPLSAREVNCAEALLGDTKAVQMLARRPNQMHSLEVLGVEKVVGVYSFSTSSGKAGYVLALIDTSNLDRLRFIVEARDKVRTLAGDAFGLGCYDLRGETPDNEVNTPLPSVLVKEIVTGTYGESASESHGFYWSRKTLDRRWLLYGCSRADAPLPAFFERNATVLWAGVAGFILLFVLTGTVLNRGLSIRVQVTLLFLLATLASVVSLVGIGGMYSEMQRATLLRDRTAQANQVLTRTDHSYQVYLDRVADRYTTLIRSLAGRVSEPTAIRNAFGSIEQETKISTRLISASGDLLYEKSSAADEGWKNLWGKEYRKILARTGVVAIKVYNAKVTFGTRLADPSIDKESLTVKRLGIVLIENLGKLRLFSFCGEQLPMFLDVVVGRDGLAEAALLIIHEPDQLETSFFGTLRQRKTTDFSERFRIRLMPFPEGRKTSAEKLPQPIHEAVDGLRKVVSQTRTPGSSVVQMRKGRYLLSGIPCRELPDGNLFLVASLDDIDARISKGNRLLYLLLALIFVFALAVSHAFLQMVIGPIDQLVVSLDHLARSDFQHQTDWKSGDEFEIVGKGVNQILEEMQELKLAINIQEHLFPQHPLKSPFWACTGLSQSHSEIGGEFYDFHPVDEDRVMILIAGVTGHAIGSALILAMMKMAIRVLMDCRPEAPDLLLTKLQATLLARIPGKHEFRLLLGTYDRRDRVIHFASTGEGFDVLKVVQSNESPTGDSSVSSLWDKATLPQQHCSATVEPGSMIVAVSRRGVNSGTMAEILAPKLRLIYAEKLTVRETGCRTLLDQLAFTVGDQADAERAIVVLQIPS